MEFDVAALGQLVPDMLVPDIDKFSRIRVDWPRLLPQAGEFSETL
jgi:hypothetical protein